MLKLNEFMAVLEEIAPLEYSKKMIEKGDYDNSGIIVKHHDFVEKALFSLDLTEDAVEKAVNDKCDTIVTHHPAIYAPIKELSVDGDTRAVLKAAASGINVISMHLNLDIAKNGIDAALSEGLGVKNAKILDVILDDIGYGREGSVAPVEFEKFIENIKKEFNSNKLLGYGSGTVERVASFCGGGASHAEEQVKRGLTDADTIVTSDMPHHVLLPLVLSGKKVVIIPHYVSEEYGFNKFHGCVCQKLNGQVQTCYFTDKRFM